MARLTEPQLTEGLDKLRRGPGVRDLAIQVIGAREPHALLSEEQRLNIAEAMLRTYSRRLVNRTKALLARYHGPLLKAEDEAAREEITRLAMRGADLERRLGNMSASMLDLWQPAFPYEKAGLIWAVLADAQRVALTDNAQRFVYYDKSAKDFLHSSMSPATFGQLTREGLRDKAFITTVEPDAVRIIDVIRSGTAALLEVARRATTAPPQPVVPRDLNAEIEERHGLEPGKFAASPKSSEITWSDEASYRATHEEASKS